MKNTHLLLVVALLATFLPSCTAGYGGRQYGCGVPQGGFGQPGFGPQGFPGGNRYSAYVPARGVQNNGEMTWDGRSSVVRFPAHAQQFGSNVASGPTPFGPGGAPVYGQSPGYGIGYQQPVASAAPQLVPSGRSITCPKCSAKIGNAPRGRFPCQRCGAVVSN